MISFKKIGNPDNKKCGAVGCGWLADAGLFMCLTHWRRVPSKMQNDFWSAYKAAPNSGRKMITVDCLGAAADAVEYLAEKDGKSIENTYRKKAAILIEADSLNEVLA